MSDQASPEADAVLGQVAALLAQEARPGLIVELGTGAQAGLAEALAQRGLGLARIDPTDLDSLASRLDALGEIGALCLLDGLDRRPEPERLLRVLSEYAAAHGGPVLVVSAPNVGHQDVALGLLAGRWLASGGSAARRFFTRDTLTSLLEGQGWQRVAAHDLERASVSEDDAASLLHAPTLAGDAVREVGRLFNPDARVRAFVWALKVGSPTPGPSPTAVERGDAVTPPSPSQWGGGWGVGLSPEPAIGLPAVSILMRTQGRRNELLTEALYSAYAQTCDDYEVVLGFHNPDDRSGELRAGVERLLGQLPAPLRRKVRLIECRGEGRGAPLNTLLEAAGGRYASFLDDDDLLLEHHVETLVGGVREHGEHVLFQTFAAQRLIDPVPAATLKGFLEARLRPPPLSHEARGPSLQASPRQREREQPPSYPYTTVAMSIPWNRPFDPVAEHHHNLVPICCMAVPTRLIRETGLRFRLDLDVGEDWDFWMGASQVLRVVVLPEVTTVVNHWNDATSNAMRRPDIALLWQQVRDARHRDHAAVPLLLDGAVRTELQAIGRQPEELAWLRDQLAQREARLKSVQRSRAWRLSELLWWASGRVRGGLKRARLR